MARVELKKERWNISLSFGPMVWQYSLRSALSASLRSALSALPPGLRRSWVSCAAPRSPDLSVSDPCQRPGPPWPAALTITVQSSRRAGHRAILWSFKFAFQLQKCEWRRYGGAEWAAGVAGRAGQGGRWSGGPCGAGWGWAGWVGWWTGMGRLQWTFIQPERMYVTAE